MRIYTERLALAAFALAVGCATAPERLPDPPPSYAKAAGDEAAFTWMEDGLRERHGPELSGFKLLRVNADALRLRLAVIDAAREQLDLQYYLWNRDPAGRIMMSHVLDAAERGVFVRILVDDLTMIQRDRGLATLDARPNIELRLFNPWEEEYRSLLGRLTQFLAGMDKLNHRMHNKLLVADQQVAIVGGRNIGSEYFGINPRFNFHDLDLLAVGPAAREVGRIFDHYFNSHWVLPAQELGVDPSKFDWDALMADFEKQLAQSENLDEFDLHAVDTTAQMETLYRELIPGRGVALYDRLHEKGERPGREVSAAVREVLDAAERELQMVNAYVIPGDRASQHFQYWRDKGVKVSLLTNSLASHDVPAVNGAYKKKRKMILESGLELYELRAYPALKSFQDTPPVESEFIGLHTKSFVVDREWVFVGSLNFDPRSIVLNTEMGLLVDSKALGEQLGRYMDEDMSPENAWQVKLDERGRVYWQDAEEVVTRQPARGFSQRVADFLFGILPIEDQL
ncbi:MAG: phospholipase D family protein [Myxococcota bacterium]